MSDLQNYLVMCEYDEGVVTVAATDHKNAVNIWLSDHNHRYVSECDQYAMRVQEMGGDHWEEFMVTFTVTSHIAPTHPSCGWVVDHPNEEVDHE